MKTKASNKIFILMLILLITSMFTICIFNGAYATEQEIATKKENIQQKDDEKYIQDSGSITLTDTNTQIDEPINPQVEYHTIFFDNIPSGIAHVINEKGQTVSSYTESQASSFYVGSQGNSLTIMEDDMLESKYFYLETDNTDYQFIGWPSSYIGSHNEDVHIDLSNSFKTSPNTFTITGKLQNSLTNSLPISNFKVILGRDWNPNNNNYSTYKYSTTNEKGEFEFKDINWKEFFDGHSDYLCIQAYPYDGYVTEVQGLSSSRFSDDGSYNLDDIPITPWNIFIDGNEHHDHFSIQLTETKLGETTLKTEPVNAKKYGTYCSTLEESITWRTKYKAEKQNKLLINITGNIPTPDGEVTIFQYDYELTPIAEDYYEFNNWTYGDTILNIDQEGYVDLDYSNQFYANYKEVANPPIPSEDVTSTESNISAQTGDCNENLICILILVLLTSTISLIKTKARKV